jgi:hypothetical protein
MPKQGTNKITKNGTRTTKTDKKSYRKIKCKECRKAYKPDQIVLFKDLEYEKDLVRCDFCDNIYCFKCLKNPNMILLIDCVECDEVRCEKCHRGLDEASRCIDCQSEKDSSCEDSECY